MNSKGVSILVSIAFVLGYYYVCSSRNPGLNKPSKADEAPRPGRTNHDTLEEGKSSDTQSRSGECSCIEDVWPPETGSSSAAEEDEDIEDDIPLHAARFSPDGELVIEDAAIAARKNAAELDRRRRAFREAQTGRRNG